MAELAPLCSRYMLRRAELRGLFAQQCAAAQGRLNAEELSDFGGPEGCVDMAERSSDGAPSLPKKRCTWGYRGHELRCSRRLKFLTTREPVEGELCMDDFAARPRETSIFHGFSFIFHGFSMGFPWFLRCFTRLSWFWWLKRGAKVVPPELQHPGKGAGCRHGGGPLCDQ